MIIKGVILKVLSALGIPHARDITRQTPLHTVGKGGNGDVIQALIQAGAEMNKKQKGPLVNK